MKLYELKQKLSMVGAQLADVNAELTEAASNPSVKMEDVKALKETKADLEERFNIIEADHDAAQKAEEDKVRKSPITIATDEKAKIVAAKAEFYRSLVKGEKMSADASRVLGVTYPIATDTNNDSGKYFLPTNLQNELVYEPFVKNPLREIMSTTNIKGLELPKMAYSVDDKNFIGDEDSAEEIALTGSSVSFGRYKFKIKCRVSDSVIYGSDINLVNWIDGALRSGLAAKEKAISFDADPSGSGEAETHHSFYYDIDGVNGIKEVEGDDMYEAITNSIAALPEGYRDGARVVMSFADYVTMLKGLSNNAATLYSAPPEMVIGKPVAFCDSATMPIVGNFQFAHLNYDGQFVFDADKDVDKGVYSFVLTGWLDQHILLRNAFRIAAVYGE